MKKRYKEVNDDIDIDYKDINIYNLINNKSFIINTNSKSNKLIKFYNTFRNSLHARLEIELDTELYNEICKKLEI